MVSRAVLVWLGIVPLMVSNGAFRDLVLSPRLGDRVARALSCITGSAVVFGMAWLYVRWQSPVTELVALRVGVIWLALTLAFEFGLGAARGMSRSEMLADYNVLAGRLWILVLISVAFAPWVWVRLT